MANWSETLVIFKGKRVDEAKSYIEGYIITGDDTTFIDASEFVTRDSRGGFLRTPSIKIEDEELIITGSGRYTAPTSFFKHVAFKFDLDLFCTDAEEGWNFFEVYEKKGGVVIQDERDKYLSKLSIRVEGVERFIESVGENIEYGDDSDIEEVLKEQLGAIRVFNESGVGLKRLIESWDISTDSFSPSEFAKMYEVAL